MVTSCGFKSHLPHLLLRGCAHDTNAEVAELADAQASGACGSNTVRVQVPPSAFSFCGAAKIGKKVLTDDGIDDIIPFVREKHTTS